MGQNCSLQFSHMMQFFVIRKISGEYEEYEIWRVRKVRRVGISTEIPPFFLIQEYDEYGVRVSTEYTYFSSPEYEEYG